MLFAFSMPVEIAMEFYQRVEERKARTEDERNAILFEMVEEGLIKDITITERSKEKYIEDLNHNFNVLKIDSKDKENNEKSN